MISLWNPTCNRMIIGMVIVGILIGCASVFQDFDDKMSRKRFRNDYEALETALEAYDQGDFEKALAQFKAIKLRSDSEKIDQRAWFGEICCCLMLAETPAEFTAAVGMWHEFKDSMTDGKSIWNQALLDPLIVRLAPKPSPPVIAFHLPPIQPDVKDAVPADLQKENGQRDDGPLQAEIIELKKRAKQADQLQRRMDKVLAENRSLKEKIKALEAIDQKIQKKKTKISTSGESLNE